MSLSKIISIPLHRFYWPALTFKLLSGIAVGLLYFQFYQHGDTLNMYNDARLWAENFELSDLFRFWTGMEDTPKNVIHPQKTKGDRVLFVNLFIAILCKALTSNYWLIGLLFSLISFLGIWELCKVLVNYLKYPVWAVALVLLFWPTTVFWSSGILKEALLMGCLGYLISLGIRLRVGWHNDELSQNKDGSTSIQPYPKHRSLRILRVVWHTLLSMLSLWFLWKVKFYFFAVLFISLGGWMIADTWLMLKNRRLKNIILAGIPVFLAGSLWLTSYSHPYYMSLDGLPLGFYHNHRHIVKATDKPSNLIEMPELTARPVIEHPSWPLILQYIPTAIFEGLFRPYPWEEGHIFKRLHSIDSLLLLASLLFAIRKAWIYRREKMSWRAWLGVAFALLYIATFSAILPITAPNIGTLVRYRVGYYPLLILLLLLGFRNKTKPIPPL